MSGAWFRVPAWCMAVHDEPAAVRARAWVYLLGAWHAGDSPSIREVRRVTGFGGGRADALVREAWAWAGEAGAARPVVAPWDRCATTRDGVAGHLRGTLDEKSGQLDQGGTPNMSDQRGTENTPAGHLRGASRARDLLSGEEKEIGGCESAPADTSAPPTTKPPEAAPPEEPLDLPKLLDGDQRLVAPLVAEGICTVEHLEAQTPSALRYVDGIGPKRAKAIQAALQRHGRDLRPEPTPKRGKDVERPGLHDLTDRWAKAYRHVMGADYAWTQGGRTSDGKASRELYDAFGWSAEPSPEVVADAAATVKRYLVHCRAVSRVPTLHDLAQGLARFRQDDRLVKASRRAPVSNQRRAEEERVEAMRDLLSDLPLNLETIDA